MMMRGRAGEKERWRGGKRERWRGGKREMEMREEGEG